MFKNRKKLQIKKEDFFICLLSCLLVGVAMGYAWKCGSLMGI